VVRNLINESLNVVDVSTWTGNPLDASFILGQLRLLHENIAEAKSTLKGEGENMKSLWWEQSAGDNVTISCI
jgi:Rogdi leucine zipper containing protein